MKVAFRVLVANKPPLIALSSQFQRFARFACTALLAHKTESKDT